MNNLSSVCGHCLAGVTFNEIIAFLYTFEQSVEVPISFSTLDSKTRYRDPSLLSVLPMNEQTILVFPILYCVWRACGS
jgi:hypothetical protein